MDEIGELLEQLVDYGHLIIPEKERAGYLSKVRTIQAKLKLLPDMEVI